MLLQNNNKIIFKAHFKYFMKGLIRLLKNIIIYSVFPDKFKIKKKIGANKWMYCNCKLKHYGKK